MENRKLVKNIVIFTLSTVLNKGLNFFVLPVLTYYLTKEDYGYLGFVMSMVTIMSIYIGLWPSNFLMAKFSKYGKDRMSEYLANILFIISITAILAFLILFASKDILLENFSDKIWLIFIIVLYTTFLVLFNTFNTIIELEKNALKYAIFQSIYSILSLSLAMLLIIEFDYGWRGRFYSEMFVLFLLSLYAIWYLTKNSYIKLKISKEKLKELFNFLFPMTFYVVGIYLLVTIDKVILAKYVDIQSVGIYTIAMTMAIVVNIIYDSFIKAWEPNFFEKIHSNSQKDQNWILLSVLLYSVAIIAVTAMYIFVVPYLFSIMIDDKFQKSLEFIPLLVVAFGLEGLRKPLSSFLMHKEKVKTLATISLIGAGINIILNIILIQKYGVIGAVYATFGAFLFLYLATLLLVFKNYDIKYRSI